MPEPIGYPSWQKEKKGSVENHHQANPDETIGRRMRSGGSAGRLDE